jgi:hypothetical protein
MLSELPIQKVRVEELDALVRDPSMSSFYFEIVMLRPSISILHAHFEMGE